MTSGIPLGVPEVFAFRGHPGQRQNGRCAMAGDKVKRERRFASSMCLKTVGLFYTKKF